MAFGSFDSKGGGSHTMSEINMVPLIDVMLVLLVIFIITAPLLAHSIRINLPQTSAEQIDEEPKTVDLAIDGQGQVFWDEKPVAMDELPGRFVQAAAVKPQPEIRIRADLNTRYEVLAKVMAGARRAGLGRIGFITQPQPSAAGQGAPETGQAAPAGSAAQPGTGVPPARAGESASPAAQGAPRPAPAH